MLDIKVIRENPEGIQKAAESKGVKIDVARLIEVDKKRSRLMQEVQSLRAERNNVAKEKNIERGKEIKQELTGKEGELNKVEDEFQKLMLSIPNSPKPDVKTGKDESENDVIRTFKEPTKFAPKDHLELGEILDIIDMERAAKVSGARFYYLKNEGVLLELALLQFALDTLMKEGFTPILPPVLIKKDTMQKLGYMENGGDEDMFQVEKDDLILVGTAEHAIASMHRDETLDGKSLPKRYVGFSASFRREAGSYGKDTRGILRVHQFDKAEMVSFVKHGEDDKEHEYLLSLEEKLFQALGIPYQVIKMCSGDLGFPAARKYDIEAWMPAQNKYREVTSVSTISDFQSRRLNTRYRDGETTVYVDILNGTAFAMARTIIAILENYQQKDGSILIPTVLHPYMNGLEAIHPHTK